MTSIKTIQAATGAPKGFALLMTLLIISVIISVGLTILDVTIKQVRLSGSAKDSEVAFHAASAGVECARYWRRISFAEMEAGQDNVEYDCFGAAAEDDPTTISVTGGAAGTAYHYEHEISSLVGTAEARCSEMDTLIIVADPAATTTLGNVKNHIAGYPEPDEIDCPAGGICTVIASRGYNRSCPTTGGFPAGTIQREILLEF